MLMKRRVVVTGGVLLLAVVAVVVTMVFFSNTMGDLNAEMNRNHVDAILASAEVKNESIVSVPVTYYDQTVDECANLYDVNMSNLVEARQFGWNECGYFHQALEKEIIEPTLSQDHLPVARGGKLLPNRGVNGENFDRWFKAIEGKSKTVAATFGLRYDADAASFYYENDNFCPLGGDGSKHLFTMNLNLPLKIMGEGKEEFLILADDDTWVYINDRIVLDMGGIHSTTAGQFEVRKDGEVYAAAGDEGFAYSGIKLKNGENIVVRIFHANRDSLESVFNLRLNNALLNVKDTTLASSDKKDDDTATIAYSPEESAHTAPLGESVTYIPDRSRMILTSVVVQASILGVLVVVTMVIISAVWRYARRDHTQE